MNSTKRNHRALARPDRSRLRKMSMNTQTRIQIQITHRKTSKIVQNTFSNGYEELAIVIRAPSRAAMIDELAITGMASASVLRPTSTNITRGGWLWWLRWCVAGQSEGVP